MKQTFALHEAPRGVGIGINKDMPVIEGSEQPQVPRHQHAVAKHVARHVAHPDHGQIARFEVSPEFSEVALDEFPGTARGDAHRLVVVADRAARGKGIAEPEPVFFRDRIGIVGECRGALVGRDNKVWVVGVVAHDPGRRHYAVAIGPFGGDIVGKIEQAPYQDLVALDRLGRELIAQIGRPLNDKAAFRSDRHDDRVLDRLRLHQAEDLGAEILLSIRPANPAASDPAGAHVHALHPRAADVDFE